MDDEWERFMCDSSNEQFGNDIIHKSERRLHTNDNISDGDIEESTTLNNIMTRQINNQDETIDDVKCPESTKLYISTKSIISYLNSEINLMDVFWNIPILSYSSFSEGVIKKQMKFNSTSQDELDIIQEHLKEVTYYTENIISSINNPTGRIKFKDIRKVSVGIATKDIMSYRLKEKGAFYNCFVMIIRINVNNIYKEFHAKIFNTGKVEIPGIQDNDTHRVLLNKIVTILKPYTNNELDFHDKHQTILVNSNFNCGFCIMREKLYDILLAKYNLQCIYDPCSYPGIQCKFYYDNQLPETEQTGKVPKDSKNDNIVKVSFMVFRTGSILIVGMCNDDILNIVYNFIKQILVQEFHYIKQYVQGQLKNEIGPKVKKIKTRRKIIYIQC